MAGSRPFRVTHIVGARPNFMKVAPLMRALKAAPPHRKVEQRLVHTGQHYDAQMSAVFFAELDLPRPDISLGVGSQPHGAQTAAMLVQLEKLLSTPPVPDLVLVPGDVNSSLAGALAAAKLQIPVGHLEAGLRSFDRKMPEELNRLVIDQLSDLLFTPSADADDHLRREGFLPERIHRVGNLMIDTLLTLLPRAKATGVLERWGLTSQGYGLLTLHRPGNVDDGPTLSRLLGAVGELAKERPFLFPVHPRTRLQLDQRGIAIPTGVRLLEPLGYLDFLGLTADAALVLTDSGGIQEETTVLGVPCLTLRENTERPITVELGTNQLVGLDPQRIIEAGRSALTGKGKRGTIPELWDGHTADRIVEVLFEGG